MRPTFHSNEHVIYHYFPPYCPSLELTLPSDLKTVNYSSHPLLDGALIFSISKAKKKLCFFAKKKSVAKKMFEQICSGLTLNILQRL